MSASVLPVLASPYLPLSGGGGGEHRQLPMSPEMYGILALIAFALLLGLLWAFRGTAYKIRDKHSRSSAGGHH